MPRNTTPNSLNRERSVIDRIIQTLFAIIIVGVVYRYCWQDVSDPYKCGALLNQGEWLDPGPRWSSRGPYQNWQPPGCIMHEYKKKDIQECFEDRRIVFVGDSTTRQIFWAVATKMDHKRAKDEITEMLETDEKHQDIEFVSAGTTVQYIWDPFLNSTRLERELKSFRADSHPDSDVAYEGAGLILLGAPGLWYARHGGETFQKNFRDSIEAVIPYMDHAREGSPGLPVARPFPFREYSPNLLLLAPVQVPWYEYLSPSRAETITAQKIDPMNDYLHQVSAHSETDVIWSYSLMTREGRTQYQESGLHVIDSVAHRKADVLLNLRCNAQGASIGYPFNRTCCSNYKQLGTAQWILLLGGMLVLPVLPFLRRQHSLRLNQFLPAPSVLRAFISLGLVVCYCFYADRTQIFEKEHKQFRQRDFLIACFVVAAAGVLSIRKSKSPETNHRTLLKITDQLFLSRDQSDEWKGWMQSVILIYHYTHASKVLWIYQIVRLLVASYLFMTGFGHTLYFLKKDDYSMRRVAGILVRLNLLSCVLPYMMRTDFAFYYFAPLVSFWFLNIYCILKKGHQRNSDLDFLLGKIILSALLATAFTMIPGILELMALFLETTCAISWDVDEIRFRIFLDMYVVYVGMLFAALYHRKACLSSGAAAPKRAMDHILILLTKYSGIFKTLTILASLTLPPGFWALIRRCPDKQDYNWWHPFISFIPTLSFITLRNCHRLLRNYHSALFAWLGRCSLETYVLQYHIWLAGDTAGILRLGIWSRWTETVILTPVFFWASWKMTDATQKLTAWIVDGGRPAQPSLYDVASSKDNQSLLPSINDGKGLPNRGNFEAGNLRRGDLAGWLVRVFKEDLRLRLGLVLAALWIVNVTYD